MGNLLNRTKKVKTEVASGGSTEDTKEEVQQQPDNSVGEIEPLSLRDCHGEVVVRKPTPYGKTSL